jgi:acyl-CoA synthetase (NDP forming)
MPRRGIGMVTASGGAAVLMSDLDSAVPSEALLLNRATRSKLKTLLGKNALVNNPVDIFTATDLDRTLNVLEIVGADSGCGTLLLFIATLDSYPDELVDRLCRLQSRLQIAIAVAGFGPRMHRALRFRGVISEPQIRTALVTVRSLGRLNAIELAATQKKPQLGAHLHHRLTSDATGRPNASLTEHESKEILQFLGLRVTRRRLVHTRDEAVRAGDLLGYPVAIKLSSRDLVHKWEIGGVKLDLSSGSVAAAYDELAAHFPATSDGGPAEMLVEEMVPPGTEIFFGGRVDPEFGPVVILARGGVGLSEAELSAVGFAPVNFQRALAMIDGLNLEITSTAARRLARIMRDVSRWISANADCLDFVDINPLTLGPDGDFTVVDALIRFKDAAEQ